MLVHLIWFQRSVKRSSALFILFTLFCSSDVISTILCSSSLIHSSASDILLLIHSRVFLISVIVLFLKNNRWSGCLVFPFLSELSTVQWDPHKCSGIVNNAEIDVFLELSCFFDDPANVGNLISGSSAFSKTSLNIWKFTVHILLKPGRGILSITLLACETSATVQQFDHSLALPFFEIGMKTDLFESCCHC